MAQISVERRRSEVNGVQPGKAFLLPGLVTLVALVLLPQFDLAALHFAAVANGQWWRLISGHLAHTNLNHLLLNLAGLWLIVIIYPSRQLLRWQLLRWISLCLLVTLFLHLLSPETQGYVGLSGFLHGLLLVNAAETIRDGERWQWLVIAGLLLKVGWELWQGPSETTSTLIEAPVLVEAHLAGLLAGGLLIGSQLTADAARRG